jgi:hypothetical protein
MSIDVHIKPKNYVNGSGFIIVVFFVLPPHIYFCHIFSHGLSAAIHPLRRSISYYDDVKKKSESELKGKFFIDFTL